MITLPRGGQKCTGNHTWQFDNGKYTKDIDGWYHGPAHCINCEETTLLWLWPRLGPMPDVVVDNSQSEATFQNLFGVSKKGGKR